MLMYKIITSETGVGVTVIFSDGTVRQLSDESPNYAETVALLTSTPASEIDEALLQKLLNPGLVVGTTLKRLSERVTFDGTNILFDGDSIDNSIADHLIRILKEDESADSYMALVNFMEKLYTNPSEKSRNSLYGFIQKHNITIDPDGDFYAYKGVREDGTSINSGFGIVNGVSMNCHLPNKPGSVLEMPRTKVDPDVLVGCSTGLHAGSYDYANGFAQGMLLLVKINPRDVVSVPHEFTYAKIRTCRYKVVNQIAQQILNTTGAYDGIDNDFEPDSDDTENQVLHDVIHRVTRRNEEVKVSFTYTRGNGDVLGIEAVVVDVKNVNNVTAEDEEDVVLVIRNDDNSLRRYRYEFIAGLTILETTKTVADTAKTVLDSLRESLDNGEIVLISFDYETLDGEPRVLEGFKAQEIRKVSYGNELLVGEREDGEIRHYRLDRIKSLRLDEETVAPAAKQAPVVVSAEDKLTEAVAKGETVACDFDYTSIGGESRQLKGFKVTAISESKDRKKLLVGEREDGEIRSYRMDRITNLSLAEDAKDKVTDEWFPMIQEALKEGYDIFLGFDYTTVDKESREVRKFSLDSVRPTNYGAILLIGTNKDGEVRSYRLDRIARVVEVTIDNLSGHLPS